MISTRVTAYFLLFGASLAAAAHLDLSAQTGTKTENRGTVVQREQALPTDVFPESRSRLPLIKREDLDERGRKAYDGAVVAASGSTVPQAAAAIRLHGSGVDVRWASPLGRRLTELAILATARECDQPYEWSLHELEAMAVGLEPALINLVRDHRPLTGVAAQEEIIIQLDREVVGKHRLRSETYARALKLLGDKNLVDIVSLMSQYAGTAARLTAFNQQLPPQMKQFLPLPFTPPDDIHPDSRSRLPLIQTPTQIPAVLYSREIAPTGTGPAQLRLHLGSRKSLEAHVGGRLMKLAILVTARELDQQYDWTMNEVGAQTDGLEPTVIQIVRDAKPLTDLSERDAAIVQFGRELFGKHVVSADTYAGALRIFGETDLVGLVDLMAQHATEAALLTAFDQHLPLAQEPLLPIHAR